MNKVLQDLYRESIKSLANSAIPNPDLDARILIRHVLKIDETEFYRVLASLVTPAQTKKINSLIDRRAKNEPIAYLTKKKEFFCLEFTINKNTLIPRPETEFLIEKGIKNIEEQPKIKKILDLGTGSGNIITALAKAIPDRKYFATDISRKALMVARKNARRHAAKVTFFCSDLFNNPRLPDKFDLIIANLPYVPKDKSKKKEAKTRESIDYEPQEAIFANDNGTAIIKRFLQKARNRVAPPGVGRLLLELDPRNARDLQAYAEKLYPAYGVELEKDLAGHYRYLTIR